MVEDLFCKGNFSLINSSSNRSCTSFSFVPNLGLSIVLKLKSKKSKNIIRVVIPIPKGLKKFIKINNINKFIATENIIVFFIDQLFPKYNFISYGALR